MKRLIRSLAILASMAPMAAFGQGAVLQGGSVTPGHVPMYVQGGATTVVQDSGPASGATTPNYGLSELMMTARGTGTPPYASQGTGQFGSNFCSYDAPITNATGYHYLCMSPNAGGGGLIAYGNGGVATALPFSFKVNGTTYNFPFTIGGIVGPGSSTVNDIAVWNNSSGSLLKDVPFATICGSNPFTSVASGCVPASGGGTTNFLRADGTFAVPPVGNLTVASTTISGGVNNCVLYDLSGSLACLSPVASAVFVTNGAGAPTLATTLPTGLTIPTPAISSPSISNPTLTGTAIGAGVIPNSVLVNSSITVNGQVCPLGGSCSAASNLIVGSTAISGGTSTGMLFNDANRLGNSSVISQGTSLGTQFLGVGNNIADAIARWSGTKMPIVVLDRTVNWSSINDNTVADLSVLTPVDSISNQYASFSSRIGAANTAFNWNHLAAFEDLSEMNGSGTLTDHYGFLSAVRLNTGTTTNRHGLYVFDAFGAGAVTNNYGVHIASLTRGGANWAVYTEGATQSQFGGNVNVGFASPASGTARALVLNGAAAGTSAGTGVLGQDGGGSTWGVGSASAINGGSYDGTLMFSSLTNAFRFKGLTAGLGTLSSNGTFTSTTLGTGVLTSLGINTNAAGGFPTYTATTWTPTLTTSATVGTPVYTTQVGSYEVVGRQVTARFSIAISSWGGSPTGNVSLAGLPLTAANTANDSGSCHVSNYSVTGLTASNFGINGVISPNTTTALLTSNGNAATTTITAAQAGATLNMTGVCFYHT